MTFNLSKTIIGVVGMAAIAYTCKATKSFIPMMGMLFVLMLVEEV